MTEAPEIVLCNNAGEPFDLTGWELTGSIVVQDDDGSVWENRSYRQDLDEDGAYEVITGRVMLAPAPPPEPEAEEQVED